MTAIVPGKYYEVRMPGEPEFGGRMRIDSSDSIFIEAHFEFKGSEPDSDALTFDARTLRYIPGPHDAFPGAVCTFTPEVV